MPFIQVKHKTIEVDKNGYIKNLNEWDNDVAFALAEIEGIELTPEHWEVIAVLRKFYREYDTSPTMRILVKQVGLQLGEEKGTSIFLMGLFPPSPVKIATKIAGLPRPTHCF